ncbi:piggyBac transposable element-derived protein 4-like [Anthonomus grandis grandis]|uniref:piggyBac transposable element-derived protein 4-like n=1 Tax=Anthonomus grandis grandis TaxID=2921223 RepID=UPI00216545E4|nr:piggyBac transposable element-derived protein 4-like [Anthonomus grandis grandis]
MDRCRPFSRKELEKLIKESSDSEPFSAGSSDNYEPDSDEEAGSDTSDMSSSSLSETMQTTVHLNSDINPAQPPQVIVDRNLVLDWVIPEKKFEPAKILLPERECMLAPDITKQLKPMQIFHKVFPHSLYLHIANCTNERLKILNQLKKRNEKMTNKGKIQKLFGCMFIMCYNRLPSLKNYWSKKESMGNSTIQKTFSRDRYMTLSSKIYFASPQKPPNASKTYYIEYLLSCFKYTFPKCRQDSQYQSIDESMTKFKGRSSMKQYMPLKPTKRGIKLWLRCDADSGYTYDVNVYSGKEDPIPAKNQSLTLGERVVTALASTVKNNYVVLCFDRFFTSVNLLLSLDYAALGTCMSNHKNVPTMGDKLQKGESQFRCTSSGLLCVKWQEIKEVLLMSNCHKPNLTTIIKKSKTGEQQNIECPEAISFYRKKCKGLIGLINLLGYMIMIENQQRGGKGCFTHSSICVQ